MGKASLAALVVVGASVAGASVAGASVAVLPVSVPLVVPAVVPPVVEPEDPTVIGVVSGLATILEQDVADVQME